MKGVEKFLPLPSLVGQFEFDHIIWAGLHTHYTCGINIPEHKLILFIVVLDTYNFGMFLLCTTILVFNVKRQRGKRMPTWWL